MISNNYNLKLNFSCSNGKVFDQRIKNSITIGELKNLLYKKSGMKPQNMVMYHYKTRLDDNRTMSSYRVKLNDLITIKEKGGGY
jgi:hypothetical protein